jgi:hypothetical protein
MTVSTAAQPGTTREAFLRSLFSPCMGVIELRALPSGAQCFATLGEGRRGGQFIAEHVEENVYVGVATRRDASGGELANCRHLAALFVDIDFKRTAEREARDRLARALLPPSAIVQSGGGVHAYWFLREPFRCACSSRRVMRPGGTTPTISTGGFPLNLWPRPGPRS